jgi:2-methylcitrate dehydratase PrpD
MIDYVRDMGGKKESTIWGYGGKSSCHMAAAVNAMQATSINFTDFHDASMNQTGPVLTATGFALSEKLGGVRGDELITAHALGLDIMGRIGLAMKTRDMYAHGWLLPQILQCFGSTTMAGRLLHLTEDQMANAYGIVYSLIGGSKEPIYTSGTDWGLWSAFSTQAGISAALMAGKGITAKCSCLMGKSGLFNLYAGGDYDYSVLTEDLGTNLKGTDLRFVLFPCSPVSTPHIVLALRLMKEHAVQSQDIETVTAYAARRIEHCFEPFELRRNPKTIGDSQVNIPYGIAVAIAKGKPGIKHYTEEGIKDPEILRISNKIVWQPDDKYGWHQDTGDDQPAKLEIKLTSGESFTGEELGVPYGHPDKPISDDDMVQKFRDSTGYALKAMPEKKVTNIIGLVEKIDTLEQVAMIPRLVV